MAQPASIITIGNFDGVHLGHQAILQQAHSLASQSHAQVLAMTFDPHPQSVLRPGTQPLQLCALEPRISLLKQHRASEVLVMTPAPDLLSLSPLEFVDRVLMQHHPLAVVEGDNFMFGKNRAGNLDTLRELGRSRNFTVHSVEGVEITLSDQTLIRLSSSLIRWLIEQGRVRDAALGLGRPFRMTARVVKGEQRGRKLNFPTANLCPQQLATHIWPADGVYHGLASLPDGSRYLAALSIGRKPTFQYQQRTLEAHLLDYVGDLYDQTISIDFLHWLRDQSPFPHLDALKHQIARDVKRIRVLASRRSPDDHLSPRTNVVADASVTMLP